MKMKVRSAAFYVESWAIFVLCGLLVCVFSTGITDVGTLRYVAVVLMLIGAPVSVAIVEIAGRIADKVSERKEMK